jgi:hypothetical protein
MLRALVRLSGLLLALSSATSALADDALKQQVNDQMIAQHFSGAMLVAHDGTRML